MIDALISAGDHAGCACLASAATPETCGAAIDVPDNDSCRLPLPTSVEIVGLPGAVMSGLRKLSPLCGPAEENDAVPVGTAGPVAIATANPSRRTSFAPSEVAVVTRPLRPRN